MLALTKKTGYGLIAITHLASLDGGELVSAREVAECYGIPASLLMNVLKDLSAAGLVESVRGARGGYRLSCDPQSLSLADLVDVIEGPFRLAECIGQPKRQSNDVACPVVDRCPIADPVHRVHRKMHDFLKTVTLAEIVEPALADQDPG
ncbi:MAG: RrF2 family transcriptional regulator [Phycisphaerae bacterium]